MTRVARVILSEELSTSRRISLQTSILKTLNYHSGFSYPLTLSELHRYLITNTPISKSRIEQELKKLISSKKVQQSGNCFCLYSTTKQCNNVAISNLRKNRRSYSLPKFKIANKVARLLSFIPTIQLICVTGSLAMQNSDQNDDIDLMIVTSANSLWLTRPLAVLLLSFFFPLRRPPSYPPNPSYPSNSLCLNLWLDTTALAMPFSRQNLRVAHELAQMRPILNKNKTYETMLSVNPWLKKFLANINLPLYPTKFRFAEFWRAFSILNFAFYILQFLYMSPRRTTEKVSLHSAFFHPRNRLPFAKHY